MPRSLIIAIVNPISLGESNVSNVPIKEMFNNAQKQEATRIWLAFEGDERVQHMIEEVVGPALAHINAITRVQQNPEYIARALINALDASVNPFSDRTNFCA